MQSVGQASDGVATSVDDSANCDWSLARAGPNRFGSGIPYGFGAGSYAFDGAGMRVKKTVSGSATVYIFSGVKVIADFQFSNYLRDSESDNDYAYAREYVNRLARFSTLDPVSGNVSDPLSWDRYPYTLDDPVNLSDPTGNATQSAPFLGAPNPGGLGNCSLDGIFVGCGFAEAEYAQGNLGQCLNAFCTSWATSTGELYDEGHFAGLVRFDYSIRRNSLQFKGEVLWWVAKLEGRSPSFGLPGPLLGTAPPFGGATWSGAFRVVRKFGACTFTGKVGATWGETALDAVGIIPGENDIVHGAQIVSAIGATAVSLFGDVTGGGLSAAGAGLEIAKETGTLIAVHGVEMVPIAGNIVSAGATIHDLYGMARAYGACMSGGV